MRPAPQEGGREGAAERNGGRSLRDRKSGVAQKTDRFSMIKAIQRRMKFVSFARQIHVSALTGEQVMKLFGKIDQAYDQFSSRIGTGVVNWPDMLYFSYERFLIN